MKYAIGPRREIGIRTIFNMLGPLTNPASATAQLTVRYDPKPHRDVCRGALRTGTKGPSSSMGPTCLTRPL